MYVCADSLGTHLGRYFMNHYDLKICCIPCHHKLTGLEILMP